MAELGSVDEVMSVVVVLFAPLWPSCLSCVALAPSLNVEVDDDASEVEVRDVKEVGSMAVSVLMIVVS